ncbi:MAG: phosphotransferase [Alicyclobacillaceae bacterium]|nr:phosphotransferase [Alicyclobacillaceae bacterium]
MLKPGTVLRGKWSQQEFVVQQRLGSGANGEVYQATQTGKGNALVALKVSAVSADIASEWRLLSDLASASPAFVQPVLMDDDALGKPFFYVMELISGDTLPVAAKSLGDPDLDRLFGDYLSALSSLHEKGYAFCDVKPENLLVERKSERRARLVDIGGVTSFGRSVRQYTPTYDRGFWGLGSRTADAAYDLVGLALVFLFLRQPPPADLMQSPLESRRKWLYSILSQLTPAPRRNSVLVGILESRIRSAETAVQMLQASPAVSTSGAAHVSVSQAERMDWTERFMWFSVSSATAATLAAWVVLLKSS